MQKNVSGQKIGAQLVSATDGSAFTGAVTVYVTGDAGTQAVGSVGSGACTHEGNGYHTYAPSQSETNYDLCAFTFVGTGAVPVTVQVFTRCDANITHWLGTACATPTVAGVPEVDVTHISGDSGAADGLEAILDGTGGVPIALGQVKVTASVSGEGAVHIVNSHFMGAGQYNSGGVYGQYNTGGAAGQYNTGQIGQCNTGSSYAVQLAGAAPNLYSGTTAILTADGLAGKVLGGGSGTISGVGARVVDSSGNAVANQATAAAIKVKTDNLPADPAGVSDIPTVGEIGTQITTDHGDGSYVDTGGGGDATLTNQSLILARINPARIVANNGLTAQNKTIYADADYNGNDTGRALSWSVDDVDLTAGTVQMAYMLTSDYEAGTGTWTNIGTGDVTAYSSGTNTVEVSLTEAEVDTLASVSPPADKFAYTYKVDVTLSGRVRRSVHGGLTVTR